MKKTFQLTHPKIKRDRMVDSVKHDVKKYLKRERNKPLPESAVYWDFDCKFGTTAETAVEVHLATMGKHIDDAVAQGLNEFYIQIISKPATGNKETSD